MAFLALSFGDIFSEREKSLKDKSKTKALRMEGYHTPVHNESKDFKEMRRSHNFVNMKGT